MVDNKGIQAVVVKDSISDYGHRLTTLQLRVPKWLLQELNTHRSLSRNAASSRATPAKEIRRRVLKDPFVPAFLGKNQKGMQARQELAPIARKTSIAVWKFARYPAVASHWILEKLSLHKQLTNRLLEPWVWADVVVSSTEWRNFFALRAHPDAQPEFGDVATKIMIALSASVPDRLKEGEWHLPFVRDEDRLRFNLEDQKKISAARCARVSLFLHDKKTVSTPEKDKEMCERLLSDGHLSPFEHVAYPSPGRHGNFVGWRQWRKDILNESKGDYEGYSYAPGKEADAEPGRKEEPDKESKEIPKE